MNTQRFSKALIWLFAVGILWAVGPQVAWGQYKQNQRPIPVDTSTYPSAMKNAYQLFRKRCGECHSVNVSLTVSFAPAQWASVIKQMQARPSSHITDSEAETILSFLTYYGAHQVSPAKAAGSSGATSESVTTGRYLYSTLGCSGCHSIAGQGGAVGPALDDVGATLSRSQLLDRLEGKPPSQIMPALPSSVTNEQLNSLVDYLLTLRGGRQEQAKGG